MLPHILRYFKLISLGLYLYLLTFNTIFNALKVIQNLLLDVINQLICVFDVRGVISKISLGVRGLMAINWMNDTTPA